MPLLGKSWDSSVNKINNAAGGREYDELWKRSRTVHALSQILPSGSRAEALWHVGLMLFALDIAAGCLLQMTHHKFDCISENNFKTMSDCWSVTRHHEMTNKASLTDKLQVFGATRGRNSADIFLLFSKWFGATLTFIWSLVCVHLMN